eukprot:TRINITY_DN58026_c0_g1_i1.p1 TRINITY_DN58026_c0_g1~~TRINITY_DN58026_c0_g1_i1.p1  ORF type:complete len:253 (-),score=38.41 TRINITY_DN58026_c0_g1_i1:62-820(-)
MGRRVTTKGLRSAVRRRSDNEATRRRRAQLARLRQGPNGKWESNAKKTQAWLAKRTSFKLADLLARARAVPPALTEAMALATELRCVDSEAGLQMLRKRLEALQVTALILRKSMIPKDLKDVAKRCPTTTGMVQPLLAKWRDIFRQEVSKFNTKLDNTKASAQASAGSAVVLAEAASDSLLVASSHGRVVRKRCSSASSSSSSTSSSSSSSSSSPSPEITVADNSAGRIAASQAKPLKQSRITAFWSAGSST